MRSINSCSLILTRPSCFLMKRRFSITTTGTLPLSWREDMQEVDVLLNGSLWIRSDFPMPGWCLPSRQPNCPPNVFDFRVNVKRWPFVTLFYTFLFLVHSTLPSFPSGQGAMNPPEGTRPYTTEDQEFLSSVIENYSPSTGPPLFFSTSPTLGYLPSVSASSPSTALLSTSPPALFTPINSSQDVVHNWTPTTGSIPSQDIQGMLINGMKMLKIPNKSSSRPKERLIKVDLMPLQISWESKKKGLSSTLDFHSIREIRLGQNTKAFDLHGRSAEFEGRAFSVIYRAEGDYKILNLVAPSRETCAMWIYGLHTLIFQMNDPLTDLKHLEFSMASFLKRLWHIVDVKNSGRLNLDEVTGLLAKLNIKLSKSEVKSTFKNASLSKTEAINFDAFERLYRILRFRPEISEVFSSLATSDPAVLSLEEFKKFIVDTQRMETWNDYKIRDYYEKYTPNGGQMDMDHFSTFLISANNSILKKEHMLLYQDMSKPLSHYFINSSHNTYLLGDQLAGESSVEGYIRALQGGCRCIELDCWDGPAGTPVIYHGRSLTNRLSLKEVCEAIVKYAFTASEFPLILSLEIHCTVDQQDVMAQVFREVFKPFLVTERDECQTTLPSPESLKRRILLKGKILSSPRTSESDPETTDAAMAPPLKELSKKNSNSWISLTKLLPGSEANVPLNSTLDTPLERTKSLVRKGSRKRLTSSSLVDLFVYLKKVHFSGFPVTDHHFDEMFSFSEKRSVGLIQKSVQEYRSYNQNFLTRVYPSGIRVTSSNFDPLPHWLVGSQIVALNYQTYDKNMQVNQAYFEGNGQCGFIIKPLTIHEDSNRSAMPVILKVKIISAQQLPKARGGISNTVIDPSIDVEVIGQSTDNAKYRTRAISSNGFNPVWNEEFTFKIAMPEMAFLRFQVQDSSSPIGTFAVHLPNLEQGYRHVPLYDWKGQLMRFSSLFVFIQKQSSVS